MKHIHMPKAVADKWLAALRSDEYRQVTGRLEKNGGFCCLGVLQHCLDGEVEKHGDGLSETLPTSTWLFQKGIHFYDEAELEHDTPYILDCDETIDLVNDSREKTFLEISDLIETELEYTD